MVRFHKNVCYLILIELNNDPINLIHHDKWNRIAVDDEIDKNQIRIGLCSTQKWFSI